ncbi:MAG: hypothetical protein AAFU57_05955 [Bacteroidota bacterium]
MSFNLNIVFRHTLHVFLIVCTFVSTYGQDESIIVKYQVRNNLGTKEYYWIIPDSSIGSLGRYKSFPLYLDFFSNDCFLACQQDEKVDLFTATTNTNYDFQENYENELRFLKKLVSKYSTEILVVNKKHTKNHVTPKQKIQISILPIKGEFVYCQTLESMRRITNYNGKIALPKGNFQVAQKFKGSKKLSELLFYADFSQLPYVNNLE